MKQAKQQSINQTQNSQLIQHEEKTSLRLNKYISDSGHCSRREADRLIEGGHVTVDGEPAVIGVKVLPNQLVTVDGKVVTVKTKKVYIALNKPAGITCTTDVNIPGNLTEFMNYPEIIFPIGRLDKESTGLLLMTSDGDIVNKILREENGHDKEYQVTVDQSLTPHFIKKMAAGVEIYNLVANKREVTAPCTIKQINDHSFTLILHQGMNRQIRRMCQELDYKVVSLKRTRIMDIHLSNLGLGQWRYLTETELIKLNEAIH